MAYFQMPTEEQILSSFSEKVSDDEMKTVKEFKRQFNEAPPMGKEWARDMYRPICEKWYKTKEYESGDTSYVGYITCCDVLGFCGGLSGWIIFLIIILILGCCASGAAAFFFFYWNRKRGGKDDKSVKEDDNTESTKSGDVVEVEIGKY